MRALSFSDLAAILSIVLATASTPDARFSPADDTDILPRSRVLDDKQTKSRLPCSTTLISMAEPVTVEEYHKCARDTYNTTDWKLAGAQFRADLDCWCKSDMKITMTEFNCCSHPDFKMLCEAECNPDCSTTLAQQCIQDCPAICLEGDYAEGVMCGECSKCHTVMKCIIEHSANRTAAGDPDHPNVCHDYEYRQSDELKAFTGCFLNHPMRTHWHRSNAIAHCSCTSNRKKAAETHSCCGASWASTICNDDCDDWNTTCETAEAKQCGQDCKQKCSAISPENMVQECKNHCIDQSSPCQKYKMCPPVGPFEHDYICDDGKKVPDNGCCGWHRSLQLPVCPSQCDTSHTWMVPHGERLVPQCKCSGCPKTIDEVKAKFNTTLFENLWFHGQDSLSDIARKAGLRHANKKMQDMMDQRDAEIMKAWKDHDGGIDAAFQAKVGEIGAKWNALIKAEAKRQFEFGPEPTPAPPTPAPIVVTSSKEEESDSPIVIIIIVAGVVGLCLIFGILVLIYKIRVSKGQTGAGGSGGGVRPNDGDPNVVVGRPVDADAPMGQDATSGAPVNNNEKGSNNNEKVSNNNNKEIEP